MSHTPGPWKLQRREPDLALVNGAEFRIGNQSLWVATTCSEVADEDKDDLERQEANARLIAAAPELLEALKQLLLVIDKAGLGNLMHGVQLGQMSWYVKASDAISDCSAAIAKATGGAA